MHVAAFRISPLRSTYIYFVKVYDSNKAVAAVDDYNTSTRSLAAATLRNFLGTRNLGEILSERFVLLYYHSILF